MVDRIETKEGNTFQFYFSTRDNIEIIWIVGSLILTLNFFGQWVQLSSTLLKGLPQLLTGLESPNRDLKSPSWDSYVLNVLIDS